jgi:GNAT superfamily N-acetyltransferase
MTWPEDLPVSAVRFARATRDVDDSLAFYRDLLGLEVLFDFRDHDGYDGVVLGLPDRSVQLELIRHDGAVAPERSDEDALVLYLDDGGAALRARLGDTVDPQAPANPYWARLGAYEIADPDGWHVLVAPASDVEERRPTVTVEPFTGDRNDLRWSFREAEDSETALDGYIDDGLLWVARGADGAILGHLQVAVRDDGATWEVLSTAVEESSRGLGIGRLFLEHACAEARAAGATRLELATAAADIGNLRFYQRCGLRMREVVRDRFVPATGYPDPIEIDGIPLRDQVWFDIDL